MSEATTAQCSAPPSEPAKRAFLRVRVMGRMERSTVLESISMVPSSMKRVRPLPAGEGVADGFGQLALLADGLQGGSEPGLHRLDEGPGSSLSTSAAIAGGEAAEFGSDGVQGADPLQHLAGDRRGAGDGQFVERPADVRPAEGELHRPGLGQRSIAAVAIDLERALEAGQVLDRLTGLAVGGVDIDGGRRIPPAPGPVVPGIGPQLMRWTTPRRH